ncbi:MAG TPA: hypothetical protein VFN68_04100 [Acidimicrobiales bacterium]|nr:hypothetical protein [Acidimicrobiales bacterium]
MGRVVVIGEEDAVGAYTLAGARVVATTGPESVRSAWADLPADTVLVVLTASAADQLGSGVGARPDLLQVVIP